MMERQSIFSKKHIYFGLPKNARKRSSTLERTHHLSVLCA
jgi:hypothetical protein